MEGRMGEVGSSILRHVSETQHVEMEELCPQ
jgi:hypothetical protein